MRLYFKSSQGRRARPQAGLRYGWHVKLAGVSHSCFYFCTNPIQVIKSTMNINLNKSRARDCESVNRLS